MIQAAKTSLTTMKRNIFMFAILNCILYIVFALSFKYLNLLHIWGLSMINFVVLTLVSLIQVRKWLRSYNSHVPFLQVFVTILFTGALSFVFFGAFVLIYSQVDPDLAQLFITHSENTGKLIAPIMLFFEGSGASIIIALIAAFYAGIYEDKKATA